MMARILDAVKMAEPVRPAGKRSGPAADHKAQGNSPRVEDVRNAVLEFLRNTLDARQVNVTKLAQIDREEGSWEAEAEVYVPNATIRALGLPVQKEVLDCQTYLLRLDAGLSVAAYGLRGSARERELQE